MGPKKPYLYQDRQVQGQTIEFESKGEPWNQYTLEDGTQLKIKVVLLGAVRLDEYNDHGQPIYQFQLQQLVGADVPPELLRKTQ